MNQLAQSMDNEANKTYTLNGMEIMRSSMNKIVDLFFAVGGSRGKDITPLFEEAMNEDLDVAIRVALYARDVRGGMGERQLFRDMLHTFAVLRPTESRLLIKKVPEIGRWDDLFAFKGTDVYADALAYFATALKNGDGLAAKWAPREKSAQRELAYDLRKATGLKAREYRKLLATTTDVVEHKMCDERWTDIDYSKLPSLASIRYQKAFERHDPDGYQKFITKLEKGETKINAGAVYPYQIISSLRQGNERVAEQQWKALPDYIEEDSSFLCMVDTSGSMTWSGGTTQPIDVAVSLGIYCAQRAKNEAFRGRVLTFSANPTWVDFSKLSSLSSIVQRVWQAEWGMNTNIERAYTKILQVAKENNVPESDMPDYLLIMSDMQFDACVRGTNSVYRNIREKFEAAGYTLPNLVFWNLNDYGSNTPVKSDQHGTALVSGFSPAIMKSILSMDPDELDPINTVMNTVMVDRYNWRV